MANSNNDSRNYKELLSNRQKFTNFLRRFVKSDWVKFVDEENLRLCDEGFFGFQSDESESVVTYAATVEGRDVYFYVMLESAVDYTIPMRILGHTGTIMTRIFENTRKEDKEREDYRLPAVVPIVYYFGSQNWDIPHSFKDYLQGGGLPAVTIDFKYTLVDINHTT